MSVATQEKSTGAPPAKRARSSPVSATVEQEQTACGESAARATAMASPLEKLEVFPPKGRSKNSQYFYFPTSATFRLRLIGSARVARNPRSSKITGEPEISIVVNHREDLAELKRIEDQFAAELRIACSRANLVVDTFRMFSFPSDQYNNGLISLRVGTGKNAVEDQPLDVPDASGRSVLELELKVPTLYLNQATRSAGASKDLVSIKLGDVVAEGQASAHLEASALKYEDVCLQPFQPTEHGRVVFPIKMRGGNSRLNLTFMGRFPYNEIKYVNEDGVHGAYGTSFTLNCSPEEHRALSDFSEKVRAALREFPIVQDFQLEKLFTPLVRNLETKDGEPPSYPEIKVALREKSEIVDSSGKEVRASDLRGRYYKACELTVYSIYVQPNSRVGFCTYMTRLVVSDCN